MSEVRIDERRLVDLALRLVSTPSFTGSEQAAAEVMRDELEGLGLQVRLISSSVAAGDIASPHQTELLRERPYLWCGPSSAVSLKSQRRSAAPPSLGGFDDQHRNGIAVRSFVEPRVDHAQRSAAA